MGNSDEAAARRRAMARALLVQAAEGSASSLGSSLVSGPYGADTP